MSAKSVLITAIVLVALIALSVFVIPAITNKSIFDSTYSFERAIIQLPDGDVIEGAVTSWTDFEDGDQIQVKMNDGKTYLLHSSNVCLISE